MKVEEKLDLGIDRF